MKISVCNLSFAYSGNPVFENLCVEFDGGDLPASGGAAPSQGASPERPLSAPRPLAILGPSGCGKTTLLKLLGGLLKAQKGEIVFSGSASCERAPGGHAAAFIFQEPRLLPWMSVLENVSLPLVKIAGKEAARERAEEFLSLVSLSGKKGAYPGELSGGEAQRVSIARAFAWPSPALFMDEPFQSLDLPLRRKLMDTTLSLLEKERRFLAAVTHEPREAARLGGRIIVLGKGGRGIVFDRAASGIDRAELEREVLEALEAASL